MTSIRLHNYFDPILLCKRIKHYFKIISKALNPTAQIQRYVTLYQMLRTPPRNNLLCQKLGGLGLNGIKLKCIIGTHGNWKKSQSWGPFWSYQLESTANPAHLPKIGPNWPNWQCCLASSSKMAPRIFFSIILDAILCKIHCYLCMPPILGV